jgi:hypothetical protein
MGGPQCLGSLALTRTRTRTRTLTLFIGAGSRGSALPLGKVAGLGRSVNSAPNAPPPTLDPNQALSEVQQPGLEVGTQSPDPARQLGSVWRAALAQIVVGSLRMRAARTF